MCYSKTVQKSSVQAELPELYQSHDNSEDENTDDEEAIENGYSVDSRIEEGMYTHSTPPPITHQGEYGDFQRR